MQKNKKELEALLVKTKKVKKILENQLNEKYNPDVLSKLESNYNQLIKLNQQYKNTLDIFNEFVNNSKKYENQIKDDIKKYKSGGLEDEIIDISTKLKDNVNFMLYYLKGIKKIAEDLDW